MTNIERIKEIQNKEEMAIIKELKTGATGAATYIERLDQVKIFIGAGDGSDDKMITSDEFNKEYEIVGVEK
jgi:hypothetical protein